MGMGDIIQMGERKVERKFRQKHCYHRHLAYDPQDQSVECTDCGRHIGAFRAFMLLVEKFSLAKSALDRREASIKELEIKHLVLRAAVRVEKAWRQKNTVPTCPHCHEAIFPGDGFGGDATNKQRALERRKFKK